MSDNDYLHLMGINDLIERKGNERNRIDTVPLFLYFDQKNIQETKRLKVYLANII